MSTIPTIDRDDVVVALVHHVRGFEDATVATLVAACREVAGVDITDDEAEEALHLAEMICDAEDAYGRYEDVSAEFRWMARDQHREDLAELAIRAAHRTQEAAA